MIVDHYKALGVEPSATSQQIMKAWRQLATQWHPDRFDRASDEEQLLAGEKYRAASAAKDVLLDADARAAYDRSRAPRPRPRRPIDLPYSLTQRGGRVTVEVPLFEGATRRVTLEVPANVRRGYVWSFPEVEVELRHAQLWTFKGWDIHGRLRVSLADILEGAEVAADGPHGALAVELPAQELKSLRIKGHGRRVPGGIAGDLVLELDIAWPTPDPRLIADLRRLTVNC